MNILTNSNKKHLLRIISVFIAIVIWLFITYTENKLIDVNINSISIQVLGENNLSENGLMLINKQDIPTASVVLRGKRQDLIGVMNNVSASIDLSDIDSAGTYKLKPSFDIPSSAVYISKRRTIDVSVEIASMKEKKINVYAVQTNTDKNKSFVVESVPEHQTVTIKGYSKDIDNIDHASVYIDVASMTKDNEQYLKPVFEDKDGDVAQTVNPIFSKHENLRVSNKVYDMTVLDVKVQLPTNVWDKYAVKLISQTPEKIRVGLKNHDMSNITEVSCAPRTDNLLPGIEEYELEINVPDGIYVPESSRFVNAELEVFEKAEKFLTVQVNLPNTMTKTCTLETPTVNVLVSGPEEKLEAKAVKAEIKYEDIPKSSGTYDIPVTFSTTEKDLEIESSRVYASITVNYENNE